MGTSLKRWRPPAGRRWTAADGRGVLMALSASGMTDAAFCREYDVARHRVDYWRKRLGEVGGGGFVAVDVVRVESSAPASPAVELTLASGRTLRFTGRWDAGALAPWLAALEARS